MRTVIFSAAITLLASAALCVTNTFVLSTVLLRVVDQTGTPIPNATISANCYTNHDMVAGRTDDNGLFTYNDRIAGGLSCYVRKPGYYETHGEIWRGPKDWTDRPPTNLTVVLKKIVAPSPLVFKRLRVLVPVLNAPVPFDFALADWVKPYGIGICSDVWITADRRKTAQMDFDIRATLTFSNALDGIQAFMAPSPSESYLASDLMPPPEAPAAGYSNSIVAFTIMRPDMPVDKSWTKNRNYVFRVRTVSGEGAAAVTANVGWINEDIKLGLTKDNYVGIMFDYYFNPDPTSRSLEPLDADKSKYR